MLFERFRLKSSATKSAGRPLFGVMTTSVDNGSKSTGGVKTTFPIDTPVINCSFKVGGVAPVERWYKGDYKMVLAINKKEKVSVPFKME
jgi:hypothetical protein